MDFELRQLRYFVALSRLQNFRQAADELRISQAALTKSIQKLEDRLQLKLFDRTTRTVIATDAGEHLFAYATDVLSKAAELQQEADLLRGASKGNISIGTGPYPPECLISPALQKMIGQDKNISVDIRIGGPEEMLAALLDRRLDFVIYDVSNYEVSARSENIEVELLPPEPVVALFRTGHPLDGTIMSFEEGIKYPWATPTPPPFFKRRLPPELRVINGPQFNMDSISACVSLVRRTDVMTLLPLSVAIDLSQGGEFRYTRTALPFVTNMGIHFVKGRTLSPAAKDLIREIRKVANSNSKLEA
ncbi:LysR family transcriptional regulator [Sneathiella sp. P13V-1]|uniref:LysR family transcriptional regulator n=1 Tax=Sneathiella sp. P13V-1 TaxID=2697366 RepID=UPI00187B6BEA|nr:LysR family transcriptional regulator [Sneathiella sp. P13V-1]MBE7635930.1 LysR family transcriptional regulator [Sneathiella sp. P13V-1]